MQCEEAGEMTVQHSVQASGRMHAELAKCLPVKIAQYNAWRTCVPTHDGVTATEHIMLPASSTCSTSG